MSVVASHAINRRLMLFLVVAVYAPTHFQFLDRHAVFPMVVGYQVEFVEFFHGPMTTLALQAGLDMPVVPKLNVFGQAVNLNPFNGSLLFPMLLQDLDPFDFVVGCGELRVATHAQFDGGNASGGRPVGA